MVKLYLDGADLSTMDRLGAEVDGFTTNPSLMRAAGVKDYRMFAQNVIERAGGKPISFEVLADDLPTMDKQAREIASWSKCIYVKLPVVTSNGDSTGLLAHMLSNDGIQLNITAVMTLDQVRNTARTLCPTTPAVISIFAGRIADTQVDPVPLFTSAIHCKHAATEILWASTREVYNVRQAELAGADIITLSPGLLTKLPLKGKDLTQYSRETVEQFVEDARGIEI